MSNISLAESGHDLTGLEVPADPPAPLVAVPAARERSAAEHARLIVAGAEVATLASLSEDGTPLASLVAFAALADGAPVVMVSTLAEHGRNLARDGRGSMCFALPKTGGDHLARGRVTLAGRFSAPDAEVASAAHDAYVSKMPASRSYSQYGDFSTYVLEVERVRWVGGYGTMASADPQSYAKAEVDPVGDASGAVKHLNEDHADALLDIARGLTGYTDAESAVCTGADRYGLDLRVSTPRGTAYTRAAFAGMLMEPSELRAASVELVARARAALA
jgi:putative heme iron utilization protein